MNEVLRSTGAPLAYLASVVLFFLGLKFVTRVRTAGRGRPLILAALALAAAGAVLELGQGTVVVMVACMALGGTAGAMLTRRLAAGALTSHLAWIPGLAGTASGLVAAELALATEPWTLRWAVCVLAAIAGFTSGYVGLDLLRKAQETASVVAESALVACFAGLATALVGVLVSNMILVIVGAVAGTAGLALARAVAVGKSRSLGSLLVGAPRKDTSDGGYENVRSCGTEEAAMVLESAQNIVIVPGLGMAIAQAQHAVKDLAEHLIKRGARVTYVISPSAGCIPGHINILLDEAAVPHDQLVFVADAGPAVKEADAVVVVGADDIVNATAAADPKNPLYGLSALDLSAARSVFVIKRTLRPGLAGVRNPLFEQANTNLIFGNAKKVVQSLVTELKGVAR